MESKKLFVNTLNGLDYSIFDVTLIIMYKTKKEEINLIKIPKNVNIQYLFNKPVKVIYQRMLYYLFMLFPHKFMNNFIVKEDYDIIVTTKDMFSYPISANKCYKVMWIHGGLEHLETEKSVIANFKRWVQKRTYSKFDKIILLTNAAKKRFGNKYNLEVDRLHVFGKQKMYETAVKNVATCQLYSVL